MRTSLLLPFCAIPFLVLSGAGAQTDIHQISPRIGSSQTAQEYTFVYRADRKLDSVSIAGDFNHWNRTANLLQVDADGLTWRATLPLQFGKYLYKFVLNGVEWVNDATTLSETDAGGNVNSVLTLTATGNGGRVSTETSPGNADKVFVLTPDTMKKVRVVQHTFVYHADQKLQSVSVAGQFNEWSLNENPLKVGSDGLTWRVTLPLGYGSYEYKFVLNGSNWALDPGALRRSGADGNVNSLLFVMPPGYDKPAKPNDGRTTASALLHEQSVSYLNYDQGQLIFSLRARPNDLRQVRLVVGTRPVPMKLVKHDDLYAFYQAQSVWNGKTNLSYHFELVDGPRVESFGANGLRAPQRPFLIDAKTFHPFVVPNWVERTVLYQIFPDRFANGDKTNDPANVVAWDSTPTGDSHFGGDIAGVKQHLSYLSDLGISGVYFNPVFKSPSIHRYDAQDYQQIDPEFGTNAEFADLTREMQRRGIRTVMDFVFNHTATTFAPFADVRKNGVSSPYKDWYLIKSFPVRVQNPPNYIGWNGFAAMPKLNLMNAATGDYMLGLVNFWKREVPLAGLRLDVANEVDVRFWRQLRTRVKGIDPQTWIVGERWGDATPWLQGDQWDAAMNYPFRDASVDFFADGKTSASQFTSRLMELYNAYPPQVARNMMNLLSSHDTPRFLTLAHGDARLQQLAATVQFTWTGTPSIYYGEELGMEGGADPDNRRGMRWDKATPSNSMLSFYKRLIAIRNQNRALQSGIPAILLANDRNKTLAYSRTLGNQTAIVALNRSEKAQIVRFSLPAGTSTRFTDALSNRPLDEKQDALSVTLAPFSSTILVQSQR